MISILCMRTLLTGALLRRGLGAFGAKDVLVAGRLSPNHVLFVADRRLGLLLALMPALEELLRRPLHLVLLLLVALLLFYLQSFWDL